MAQRAQGEIGSLRAAEGGIPRDDQLHAARLRDDPRFRPALARYCLGMCEAPPDGWPLYKLFDQFNRYVASFMLIHNYYDWRDGHGAAPTLAVLQRRVNWSPRQTAGFVAGLKAGQFIHTQDDPRDRRNKLLRPGATIIREIGRSYRLFARALDEIVERSGPPPPFEDVEWLGRLIQRSAARVLACGTLIHSFPALLHLTQRDCGYPVLTAIMAAHYCALLPGLGVAPGLTRRALAQRFQVSAAHIGNLIAEAESHGWFSRGGEGVKPTATLCDEFELWAAVQMLHIAQLVAAMPPPGGDDPAPVADSAPSL